MKTKKTERTERLLGAILMLTMVIVLVVVILSSESHAAYQNNSNEETCRITYTSDDIHRSNTTEIMVLILGIAALSSASCVVLMDQKK